jgi:ribosome-associated protein
VGSIADKLLSDLKAEGFYANVEGLQESKWVLIDAWDVVVHIFTAEERENYSLEKMWGFELPTSKTAQDH